MVLNWKIGGLALGAVGLLPRHRRRGGSNGPQECAVLHPWRIVGGCGLHDHLPFGENHRDAGRHRRRQSHTLGTVPGAKYDGLMALPGDVLGIVLGLIFVTVAFAVPEAPRGDALPAPAE